MDLNLEQLNSLSRIVAEELRKRCESFRPEIPVDQEVTLNQTNQTHLVPEGGQVWEVSFMRKLYTGGSDIRRWYLVHPSRQNGHVVCYPNITQAEMIINGVRTIGHYERSSPQIQEFTRQNDKIQDYLASISIGVETGSGGPPDKSWIIDPLKLLTNP